MVEFMSKGSVHDSCYLTDINSHVKELKATCQNNTSNNKVMNQLVVTL